MLNNDINIKNFVLVGIALIIIVVGTYFIYQSSQHSQPTHEQEAEVEITFQTNCQTNADCKKYISYNNCDVYCANNEEINNEVLSRFKVTCDSTLWDPPFSRNCNCINNNCQFVE